jgi:hypothetical protein
MFKSQKSNTISVSDSPSGHTVQYNAFVTVVVIKKVRFRVVIFCVPSVRYERRQKRITHFRDYSSVIINARVGVYVCIAYVWVMCTKRSTDEVDIGTTRDQLSFSTTRGRRSWVVRSLWSSDTKHLYFSFAHQQQYFIIQTPFFFDTFYDNCKKNFFFFINIVEKISKIFFRSCS